MEFRITWKYPAESNNADKFFNQIVKLKFSSTKVKVEMPSFCMGVYIANLFNACKIDRQIDGYIKSPAFEEWRNIVGETYLNLNDREYALKYILFDSIAYPAFCIFKNVRTMLEEISGDESHKSKDLSKCTQEILGDLIDEYYILNPYDFAEQIQSCIDKYIEQFNELLMSSREEFGREFYEKLCVCLKKYNESDMIKQYLAKQGEKERCFATFIEDDTDKKYISFSGFVDAIDPKIIKWLNGSKTEASAFVQVAREICSSMGAEFVPTNLETRRYYCESCSPLIVNQGLSLDDIIYHDLKSWKKYYSCCERKIFGRFQDNTPNGKLYVKMKICGECSLGLYYQLRNGNTIVLFDGLEC